MCCVLSSPLQNKRNKNGENGKHLKKKKKDLIIATCYVVWALQISEIMCIYMALY